MDLWDLTRLLLRRWYFAVPMLAATVAVVFLAAQQVSPDYKALGYMQLIPAPSSGKPIDPDAKPKPSNPWLDLGYAALANAASLTVSNPATLEKMADQGLSDSVTVVMNERTPLYEIEVVGDSREQATATVQRVIKLLQDDIAAKQKQYDALEEDTITTLVINDGSAPEQDTSTRKRVLIVAAGLGVLLTTAATIALDYWLRRRKHRKTTGDGPAPPASVKSEPVSTRQAGLSDDAERTQALIPQPRQGGGVRHSTETRHRSAHAQRDTNAPATPVPAPAAPVDATVVLPMPYKNWNSPKKRS
ncbi:hypothetical protein [Actinoplanes derwentensis]|uniref:Capsular polysaccharide biosynthesis protein n=1 Tax=Actinoplanes derwentensis TaxID=113562 RepID=A0A1H2BC36_9ACTN|nr:hypothetical protein [Actinoplanes derwentensis]GID88620.1 hypothetical protein Ade03nite_75440 [Actinoplanes derwentensis]SDT55714.1 hypothetical protein SAMN04489716_4498 [Actinoplanes derwentensis]